MTEKLRRRAIAEKIADLISDKGLTQPFGGEVYHGNSNGRTYHGVTFAIPRLLDGEVRVYGPEFIMIRSRGPAEMPLVVFDSVDNALEFLDLAFAQHKGMEAMQLRRRGQ